MLELCQQGAAVSVFDRTPRGGRFQGLMNQLLRPLRYLAWSVWRPRAVFYLGLSGGNGQWFDLPYALIARLFAGRIFVHHHSFAYIRRPRPINRILFAVLSKAQHIVLSAGMGRSLAQTYGLKAERVTVLSNAALFPAMAHAAKSRDAALPSLRIGFLSNITLEKGIAEFFLVLDALKHAKVPYRASVAGPVAENARPKFDQLLTRAADTRYLGALYGDAKEAFYDELDVLLFPTKYANEAEPLVIHEAMRHGVYTLACDRGAIAETLEGGAGEVFADTEFVASAARWLAQVGADVDQWAQLRAGIAHRAEQIRLTARADLVQLLQTMRVNYHVPDES